MEPAAWTDAVVDLLIGFGFKHQQFRDAEEFYENALIRFGSPRLFVTGHSLPRRLAGEYIGEQNTKPKRLRLIHMVYRSLSIVRLIIRPPETLSTSQWISTLYPQCDFPALLVNWSMHQLNFLLDRRQITLDASFEWKAFFKAGDSGNSLNGILSKP